MVVLRTVAGLLAVTVCLAGCGAPAAPDASPVFVEPSQPVTTAAATTPPAAPVTTPAAPSSAPPTSAKPSKTPAKPKKVNYVFPVRSSNVDFHTTHGKYPATDIFADCGEPAVATTDGVVLEVSLKDEYVKGQPDGPLNGGLSVSILGDDGVRYYGSHLTRVQSGIRAGVRVTGGQQIGVVGRTGNANGVCHLHYGISPPCARTGDWKVRRGVIWPAQYLRSWRAGGDKSPVDEVADWKADHRCKA